MTTSAAKAGRNADIVDRLEAKIERMETALHQIDSWSRAYPLKAFPEPDMAKAAKLLKAGGMTLDAISASNMRHVVGGVGKIARRALAAEQYERRKGGIDVGKSAGGGSRPRQRNISIRRSRARRNNR